VLLCDYYSIQLKMPIRYEKIVLLSAQRYASADTSYGPVSVRLSVSVCVCHKSVFRSIETVGRIGLVFGTEASFDQPCIVL